MNYHKQAQKFADTYGVKLKINRIQYGRHFANDHQERYIFNCTLSRNGKRYTFNFGQSVARGSDQPTTYDLLCCLTKYEIDTFEDFCAEYGYNPDSINALKTFKAVKREFNGVNRLFGDILPQLQEIQ